MSRTSSLTVLAALFVAAVVAFAALTGGASPVQAQDDGPRARLAAAQTFAFALGDGSLDGDLPARDAGYDLVVVDGEEATAAKVAGLRVTGKVVLAYLSVGTIERGRGWTARAKRYKLDRWEEWDEDYANVRAAGFRELIAGTVAPGMLAKGFDGLFLDNTDMIESHRAQTGGMRRLVAALSALVDADGKLLASQNGEGTIGPSLAHYDLWNREDVTSTYDFDRKRYTAVPAQERAETIATLQRIAATGLRVTATDYVRAGDAATTERSIAGACEAGAMPFVSDIGLTRLPAAPPRCG